MKLTAGVEAGQRDTEQRRLDKGAQSSGGRLTITKEKAEREYGET